MKKGLGAFFVMLCFLSGAEAVRAQEGIPNPSESELINPSSMSGLCTSENKGSMFYENYCLAIQEQLNKDCTKELVKNLRQQYLGKAKDNKSFSAFGKCENSYSAIEKNEQAFENLILQFMADLAIAESKHREYNNLEHAKMADNSAKQGGLFNLTQNMIQDEKYKCGCENINSKGDGKDLTVNDAHLQATCATYIALYWADKHGELYGGNKKASSKNCQPNSTRGSLDEGPIGAACIFKSLQEIDLKLGQTRKPDDEANSPELNMIEKKVINYCKKSISPDGTVNDGKMYLGAPTGPVRSQATP